MRNSFIPLNGPSKGGFDFPSTVGYLEVWMIFQRVCPAALQSPDSFPFIFDLCVTLSTIQARGACTAAACYDSTLVAVSLIPALAASA